MGNTNKTFFIVPQPFKIAENFELDSRFFEFEENREYLRRGFFENDLIGVLGFENVLVPFDHLSFGYPNITIVKKNGGKHLRVVLSANSSEIFCANNDEVIIEYLVKAGINPSNFEKMGK